MPSLAPLLALLLAQSTSQPPGAATWAGTVALGLIALTGNSQTVTLAGNAALERKSPEWIWGVKAVGAYGQNTAAGASSSTVTALNAAFQARGDRRFTEQLALYLLAGIDTDHLKSIEARPFGEGGVSFTFWDRKEGDLQKSTLRADAGFRYGRELRFQYYPTPADIPDVDVAAPRLGGLFRYAFNKDVIFSEEVSALLNVAGQARALLTSSSRLTSRLTEKVALGVSFAVSDDTVPPPGKVSVDTALTVGLEVGI